MIKGVSMEWNGRLGVPYQGSKNAIAKEIVSILPSGKRFVDLFAGGCAVTHAAMLSGKYSNFHLNDSNGLGVCLFVDSIKGKYIGSWRRFVSRDEFNLKKKSDPLISLCWSFSNNGRDYLYSYEKESVKREAHERYVNGIIDGERPEHIERLQAIDNMAVLDSMPVLNGLGLIERTTTSFLNYSDVQLVDGDVVYCDPPYAGTRGYNNGCKFNSNAFWDWCAEQDRPIFVSEYKAPDCFVPVPIWTKQKCQLMNSNGTNGKVREFVFVQKRFADMYQTDLFNCK